MDLDKVINAARTLCLNRRWGEPKLLGEGNSGAVFEIVHPEHGHVALKVYDSAFFDELNEQVEVSRLRLQEQLKGHGNPYLIEVIEADKLVSEKTWFILMELCPWPTLDKQITTFPPEKIEDTLHQLVEAVLFLQKKTLVHRDIKPSNIAISPDYTHLKLLDLGVLRQIDLPLGNGTDIDASKRRFVATVQYSPPEYIARQEPVGAIGFAALNLYQVGAVLHDMIMKRPLFGEEAASMNRYMLYEAVKTKRPIISNPALPTRLISMCHAALDKDPLIRVKRVTLEEMLVPTEQAEAVRRRLAGRPTTPPKAPPLSVALWKRAVSDWIAAAAATERETLGSVRRTPINAPPNEICWRLYFPECSRDLRCELTQAADGQRLILSMAIDRPTAIRIPVLDIFDQGPEMESDAVVKQLAEQMLYMLDLMGQPSDTTNSALQGEQP